MADKIEQEGVDEGGSLQPPSKFSFPFAPYAIQEQFMRSLFSALEDKKLGIFESPTGTGKSLSLLCGSLTWLEEHEKRHLKSLKRQISKFDLQKEEAKANSCENWIKAQHQLRADKEKWNAAKRELKFLEDLIDKRRRYLSKRSQINSKGLLKLKSGGDSDKKSKLKEKDVSNNNFEDEDDFAPDYLSDSDFGSDTEIEEPEFFQTKIFFASRTHSQLGQFCHELQKTEFAKRVTMCSLGSRQNLCINNDVNKLKSLSLINERCLELQKKTKPVPTSETKKQKSCNGCPYFQFDAINNLKSVILSEPLDIEDLVKAGKELKACPYYASRKASKEAQLIALPYNTLLHSGTREGVGIRVDNSVLILDEAHNIVESLSGMHSCSINKGQLEDCSKGLKMYMNRYIKFFKPKKLLQLKQILFIQKSLLQVLNKTKEDKVFHVHEFKVEAGIDNLDLYELCRFMRNSKLIFKLKGYLLAQNKKENTDGAEKLLLKTNSKADNKDKEKIKIGQSKENSNRQNQAAKDVSTKHACSPGTTPGQAVLAFSEFFSSLLTFDSDGRIIADGNNLKFLMLNSSKHFLPLVKSSRSIIFAGGTMKPYDDIEDQLFHSQKHRIHHFACDHVIPDQNLICIALNKGPTSGVFDFTFNNRKKESLMEELSRTILNLSSVVPGGIVCFLPSYDYESYFYSFLQKSKYAEKIETKKKIFRESKDSSTDQLLTDYTRLVTNSKGGAILFAVVGGKLSEGINFSDDLGRCLIVVGLPYPNITSLEIKEKVNFYSEKFGTEKGSALLANMCSKAVNQSIGRAIRHANDYAAIILLDQRYSRPSQMDLLPNWILKRFKSCDNFGEVVGSLGRFFSAKRLM